MELQMMFGPASLSRHVSMLAAFSKEPFCLFLEKRLERPDEIVPLATCGPRASVCPAPPPAVVSVLVVGLQKSSLIRLEAKNLPTLRLKEGLLWKGGFLLGSEVATPELSLLGGASDEGLSSSEVKPSDVSSQDSISPSDAAWAGLGGEEKFPKTRGAKAGGGGHLIPGAWTRRSGVASCSRSAAPKLILILKPSSSTSITLSGWTLMCRIPSFFSPFFPHEATENLQFLRNRCRFDA